jgi:hypothetical protein
MGLPYKVLPATMSRLKMGNKAVDIHDPQPVLSVIKVHAAYTTLQSFFYLHSMDELEEQIILYLKLAVEEQQ